MCVLVGANGTGKTTFFDVFSFLKDALAMNVGQALAKRGGWREVVSRGKLDASIEISLRFRLPIAEKTRLVTYILEIGLDDSGKPIIYQEILSCKRSSHGTSYHFLEFSRGSGFAISNEEDFSTSDAELRREDQRLDAPDILAIKLRLNLQVQHFHFQIYS